MHLIWKMNHFCQHFRIWNLSVSYLLQLKFLFNSCRTPILQLTQFRTWKCCKACKRALCSSGNNTELPVALTSAMINKSITKSNNCLPNLPQAQLGKFHKPRTMWLVHACIQNGKSLFIPLILGSMLGTSGCCFKP